MWGRWRELGLSLRLHEGVEHHLKSVAMNMCGTQTHTREPNQLMQTICLPFGNHQLGEEPS